MKKNEIKLSILDDTRYLPEDIEVSESEKERIFEMSKRMYDIKKNAAAQSYEPADEVSGVEIYRRPRWYKAVSIAAAFVLAVAAITGSALMIRSLRNTPERLATELSYEAGDMQAAPFEDFLSLGFGTLLLPETEPDENGNNAYTSPVTAESIKCGDKEYIYCCEYFEALPQDKRERLSELINSIEFTEITPEEAEEITSESVYSFYYMTDDELRELSFKRAVGENDTLGIAYYCRHNFSPDAAADDGDFEAAEETAGRECINDPCGWKCYTFDIEGFMDSADRILSGEAEEMTEPEEVLSAELSYDMSTKEGIYNKMLNSIDFFDKASGRYICSSNFILTYPECDIRDFSVDLDAAQSYLKRTPVLLNNPEEVIGGMPADAVLYRGMAGARISDSFTDYCDGERRYWIVDNFKRPDSTFSEPGVLLEPYQRDRTPYNADDIAAIKDHYYNGGTVYYYNGGCRGYREYNGRSRQSELVTIYRTPDSYASSYLTMFELWDIAGEETFAGRDCVVIEGLIEKEPIKVDWTTSFTMYVDKETGFVVSFVNYDEAGKIADFAVFEELFFDDEAEMVILDLDQYDIFDPAYYETDK